MKFVSPTEKINYRILNCIECHMGIIVLDDKGSLTLFSNKDDFLAKKF